jgi:hypothetical protein
LAHDFSSCRILNLPQFGLLPQYFGARKQQLGRGIHAGDVDGHLLDPFLHAAYGGRSFLRGLIELDDGVTVAAQ